MMKKCIFIFILLIVSSISSFSQTSLETVKNSDGFIFHLLKSNKGVAVKNDDDEYIIPFSRGYKSLEYNSDYGYFYVSMDDGLIGTVGICDRWGKVIILPNAKYRMIAYSPKKGFNYFDEGYPAFGIFLDQNHRAYKLNGSGRKVYLSDVPPAVLLAKGKYTISSQGYCTETGQYTESLVQDWNVEVEFYDDYILINGVKCEYKGISNGWKLYEGEDMNFSGSSSYSTYYVNPNYDMKKIVTSTISGMGYSNMSHFLYTMEKGDVCDVHYSSTSNAKTKTSINRDKKTSLPTTSSKRRHVCPRCKGNKRIVRESHVSLYGQKDYRVRCNECGRYFMRSTGHSHINCPQCYGKGYFID